MNEIQSMYFIRSRVVLQNSMELLKRSIYQHQRSRGVHGKYPVKFCSDWWRGICQKWKCWGDIQNKISEWKGILYRKGWFVWETPSSLVCPGSRVYGYETQDMDKIKERLMIKFSRCQAKQLKFISKSLESHWNISSKEMVLYFFYFVKIAIIISMKRYGSALWKERPFGRDKEY